VGGALFRSLAEAGLVDTVEVGVVPILLGSGIPLAPAPMKFAGLVDMLKIYGR
jgi:dihydrofolate reductase